LDLARERRSASVSRILRLHCLLQEYFDYIEEHEAEGLGVSVISCWEVAKLVEGGRITLSLPVGEWIAKALSYPGMRLLDFSPEVAVESTQLPGVFHRDPADQIIVATARIHACPLVTMDTKIRAYPHVRVAP
jgi:PIN domain nuclease of toxin-antitoxin system